MTTVECPACGAVYEAALTPQRQQQLPTTQPLARIALIHLAVGGFLLLVGWLWLPLLPAWQPIVFDIDRSGRLVYENATPITTLSLIGMILGVCFLISGCSALYRKLSSALPPYMCGQCVARQRDDPRLSRRR
jgi:hypothetical protein